MAVVHLFSPESSLYWKGLLEKKRWDDIFLQINSSNIDMKIDDTHLGVAVLKKWCVSYGDKRGAVAAIPDSFSHKWAEAALPEFGQKSSISLACHYGQWALAHLLLDKGFCIDTPHWSIWDAIISGYHERCPQKVVTMRNVVDHSFNDVTVLANSPPVHPTEAWNLRLFMTRIKPIHWSEYGKTNVSLGFLSAITGHQNHLVEAFLVCARQPPSLIFNDGVKDFEVCPIQAAIAAQNITALRLILDWGVYPLNLQDQMSVFEGAVFHNQEEILDLLIKKLPARDIIEGLFGALAVAVAEDNIPMTDFLVHLGAPWFGESEEGFTLLHQAAVYSSVAMIEKVLSWGLCWDKENKNGLTPKDMLEIHQPSLYKIFFERSNVIFAEFARNDKI